MLQSLLNERNMNVTMNVCNLWVRPSRGNLTAVNLALRKLNSGKFSAKCSFIYLKMKVIFKMLESRSCVSCRSLLLCAVEGSESPRHLLSCRPSKGFQRNGASPHSPISSSPSSLPHQWAGWGRKKSSPSNWHPFSKGDGSNRSHHSSISSSPSSPRAGMGSTNSWLPLLGGGSAEMGTTEKDLPHYSETPLGLSGSSRSWMREKNDPACGIPRGYGFDSRPWFAVDDPVW